MILSWIIGMKEEGNIDAEVKGSTSSAIALMI
jgi:hypothetical protein